MRIPPQISPSFLRTWWQDRLLRGVIKNSGYLFSSNSLAAVFAFVQGIFATRLLGAEGFGIVSGIVITFASNVHRLLSFRMNEVVVKTLQEHLAEGRKDRAGALVKGAALIEGANAAAAYGVVLLAAPLAARFLAKDTGTTVLFSLYGIYLLANFAYETSLGVLQATDRFKQIAAVNLAQSAITAGLIFAAFLGRGGLVDVLLAYLIGKSFAGVSVAVLAFRSMNRVVGTGWLRAPLSAEPDWKGNLRFGISTNLNGTINLIVRDSEPLLVAWLLSPVEAGYFKLALGLVNLVITPIDPLIWPTYASISGTIARREWKATLGLLKKVSAIAGAWTAAAGGGLILIGWWLVPFVYGEEFAPAYPALALLLLGYGFANIFQWNRPLLLALGLPEYPVKVSALVGAVKTALTFTLTPVFGYLAEAALLSGYFIASISAILRRGLVEIARRKAQEPERIVVAAERTDETVP